MLPNAFRCPFLCTHSLGGIFPFHDRTPVETQIATGEFIFPDEYFKNVGDDGQRSRSRRRA